MGAWARYAEQIDAWMKMHAPNEVAMLVAENPGKVQRYLKALHAGYADDETYNPRHFATHHIVDTVTFAEQLTAPIREAGGDNVRYLVRR
jgi:hypothetical protein